MVSKNTLALRNKNPRHQGAGRNSHTHICICYRAAGAGAAGAGAAPEAGAGAAGAGAAPEAGAGAAGAGAAPGAGAGAGEGTGTGRDPAAAQRPSVPPRLLSGSAPVYPKELERNGITGTVGLAIVVGADGGVQSVDISSSSGRSELDQAAIAAAYTYRFEPARNIYDEPVACRVNRSFSFS